MNPVSIRVRIAALLAGIVLAALGLGVLAVSAHAQQRTKMVFGGTDSLPEFDTLGTPLPPSDREVVTLRGESGDVVRFGDDILVPAGQRVRGNVVAIGGDITVAGIIDGDAVSVGGVVRVEPGGDVRGEEVTVGSNDASRWIGRHGPGVVSGRVSRWEEVEEHTERTIGRVARFWTAFVMLLLFAGFAWLASLIYAHRTQRAMAYLRERPGPSFLLGLAAMVGLVPSLVGVAIVAAILCITLIGIPVAVLLLLGYLFGVVLLVIWGYFVAGGVAGDFLLRRLRPQLGTPTLLQALLAGTAIIWGPMLIARLFDIVGAGPLAVLISVLATIGFGLLLFFGIGAVIGSRAGQPPVAAPASFAPPPIDPYATPTGPTPSVPPVAPPPTTLPPGAPVPPPPVPPVAPASTMPPPEPYAKP